MTGIVGEEVGPLMTVGVNMQVKHRYPAPELMLVSEELGLPVVVKIDVTVVEAVTIEDGGIAVYRSV